MSFLPNAVDGKRHALKGLRPGRDQAVDRQDNWLESEHHFFDATTVSENEWNIDTPPRDDAPAPDARPSAHESRVMVVGLHLIRV
jgi:hypothetical protein